MALNYHTLYDNFRDDRAEEGWAPGRAALRATHRALEVTWEGVSI
jgi:hypothetical protein